ncbi:MAG: hypothetical protein ACRDNX_02325 [Gaiellaceae bacterium]
MRERWFGASGIKVPEIAVEGDPAVPLEQALVLDEPADVEELREAHARGTAVVVRADSAERVKSALMRPEVSCVLVPADRADLLELDLTAITYG